MKTESLSTQEIIELTSKIVNCYEKHVVLNGNPPGDSSVEHILNNNLIIRRQVDIDAYLISQFISSDVGFEAYGCDFSKEEYGILYKFCNLRYTELSHSYQLPYEDNYFDSVISSGVLEHVPNDYESLKEIYRILREDGYLIITFLPNQNSYTEFISSLRHRGHKRKYVLAEVKKDLLHSGFLPLTWGFHQWMPSLSSLHSLNDDEKLSVLLPIAEAIYNLNGFMEKVWLLNRFAANLFIIAQKKLVM
jgi:SAM-dependent methyltransferase